MNVASSARESEFADAASSTLAENVAPGLVANGGFFPLSSMKRLGRVKGIIRRMSQKKSGQPAQRKKRSTGETPINPSSRDNPNPENPQVKEEEKPFLMRTGVLVGIAATAIGAFVTLLTYMDKKRGENSNQRQQITNAQVVNSNKGVEEKPSVEKEVSSPGPPVVPRFSIARGGSGKFENIEIILDDIRPKEGGGFLVFATVKAPGQPSNKIQRGQKGSQYEHFGYLIGIEDITSDKATFSMKRLK